MLATDCLMLDKIKQLRQPSRGNAARADLLPGGVEQTAQLAIDPVRRDLGARAALALLALVAHRDHGLEVIGYLAFGSELVGIVGGETILRDKPFAFGVIVLSPASRGITYYLAPHFRGHIGMMLHTRLDTIMFGCLLALLWDDERFVASVERLLRPWNVAAACFFLIFVDRILNEKFHGYYSLSSGMTLQAICISVVLVYFVRKPQTLVGRWLNNPAVRHMGVISYGLYLWNQLFTSPGHGLFPLNILAAWVCAELSYRLLERPILKARDSLELKVALRPVPQPSASVS